MVPGVGTRWQLKHQEKHLSDDTLGTYLPQIPAVLFYYLSRIGIVQIVFSQTKEICGVPINYKNPYMMNG